MNLNLPIFVFSREENIRQHKKAIRSYKARADARRKPFEKIADIMTSKFGSITFLGLNAVWFASWILVNTGKIPGIEIFDPFPFGLLTMIVSLEAIFLAIIVLISQNRAAKVEEVREEADLYINSVTEGEVTKIISLLLLLLEKNGIDVESDPALKKMLRTESSSKIETLIEKELS